MISTSRKGQLLLLRPGYTLPKPEVGSSINDDENNYDEDYDIGADSDEDWCQQCRIIQFLV